MAEEENILSRLPIDLIVDEILLPIVKTSNPEKTLFQITSVNKLLKDMCKNDKIRAAIDLSAHFCFDCCQTTRYMVFIQDCADKGNENACLCYGLSMVFCFCQRRLGMEYLEKIKHVSPIAAYAYALFKLQRMASRDVGVAEIKKLKDHPSIDHIDSCRMKLLFPYNPELLINTIIPPLVYSCRNGVECDLHPIRIVGGATNQINISCGDEYEAIKEYTAFRMAFLRIHIR